MSVKHVARTPLAVANATREQVQARNSQLRARFPARPVETSWPQSTRSLETTQRRVTSPPFVAGSSATRACRRRGVIKLLRWLSSVPGETWQQRWLASGVETHPGAGWVQVPAAWLDARGESTARDAEDLSSGLLMLICGDVIRPGLAWMLTRTHRYLASVMAQTRDPAGFARLHELAAADPAGARMDARVAETRIATLLACKGGTRRDGGVVPTEVLALMAEIGAGAGDELGAGSRVAAAAAVRASSALVPGFARASSGPSPSPAWLTVNEAASALGMDPRSVRKALSEGRLAGQHEAERTPWRVDPAAVAHWKPKPRRRTA